MSLYTARFLGLLVCLLVIISSCRTSKVVYEQVTPRSASEVLDSLSAQQQDYDFFYAKAKMKYNGEESRLGGRITMMIIPDSLIWMNFKKISIEGARTLIRPDSMWILYRLDDLYEADLTQEYLDFYQIDLSFNQLQDLIIGNFHIPDEEELLVYQESDHYILEFKIDQGYYQYKVDNHMNISYIRINDIQGRTFAMSISDYDEQGFGRRKDIHVTDIDSSLSRIAMKFSSATFDEPRAIKFDIPDHYRKLP